MDLEGMEDLDSAEKGAKEGMRGRTTHVDSKAVSGMNRDKDPLKSHVGNRIRGLVCKPGVMRAVHGES